MAISFVTGTSGDSANAAAASQTLTIPAGVLAGHVVILVACGFAGASGAVLSAASTGTTPTLGDRNQTVISGGLFSNGGWWWFVASGTDAGKVVTFTLSGGTNPFWSAALAAYAGASNAAPIDVHGAATAVNTSPVSTPALTTGVSGDWAVYMAAAGVAAASGFTEPASTTSRQLDRSTGNIVADIADTNASVGGGGTGIGGASAQYTSAVGGGNWWSVFTVGLAPAPAPGSGPGTGNISDDQRKPEKLSLLGLI